MTKDLGFRMSRHIILFSMPLSELVHTLPSPICHFISNVFKSGIDTTHCLVLGEIAMKFETENASMHLSTGMVINPRMIKPKLL